MKISTLILATIVGAAALAVSLIATEKKSAIEIRKITPADDEILEEWLRVTKEPDVLGVDASKGKHPRWRWQVFINAAEFVRKDPLAARLDRNITAALKGVAGVTAVAREDTEVWVLQGEANGEDLVRACAVALDQLAPEIRRYMADL
jgi:hypothetical protein